MFLTKRHYSEQKAKVKAFLSSVVGQFETDRLPCPLELIEAGARGIHLVVDSGGGEVALRKRKDTAAPEVFFISHMSADYANIVGFAEVAGKWEQLYCGKYFYASVQESEIHVCR